MHGYIIKIYISPAKHDVQKDAYYYRCQGRPCRKVFRFFTKGQKCKKFYVIRKIQVAKLRRYFYYHRSLHP